MEKIKMFESGYKRRYWPKCEACGQMFEPDYTIKGWIKCTKCGRLYSRKHKFDKLVE